MPVSSRVGLAILAIMLAGGAVFFLTSMRQDGDAGIVPARVWHIDHWDYPGQSH